MPVSKEDKSEKVTSNSRVSKNIVALSQSHVFEGELIHHLLSSFAVHARKSCQDIPNFKTIIELATTQAQPSTSSAALSDTAVPASTDTPVTTGPKTAGQARLTITIVPDFTAANNEEASVFVGTSDLAVFTLATIDIGTKWPFP